MSGMHARAYQYHDSSICHPQHVTYMKEHITITTPVYTTHNEWHACKSVSILWLQCMSPRMSGIHARAYHYHGSSTCHPQRVACAHKHTTTAQYVSLTASDMCTQAHYHVSSTCHLVRGAYARAHHHNSSICHPRRVTYMEEHTTKPPVHSTHGEWHACTIVPS